MAGRNVLLDAGPIVAMLDKRDQWHARMRPAPTALLWRSLTTEAVVTEATHLIGSRRSDAARVLELLTQLDIPIVAVHRPLHEACIELMRRYAAVPMDYADATLVALAERLDIRKVFTFDVRGFTQYRGARKGTRFEIVPNPRA